MYDYKELVFIQTRNILRAKPCYELVLRVLKNKQEQLNNSMKAANFDRFAMLEIVETQKEIDILKTFLTLHK